MASSFLPSTAAEPKYAEPKYKDVLFGRAGETELRLDIYQSGRVERPQPLIVWVHGGAWRRGSRANVPIASMVDRGFAVASVDYRLSTVAPFPAQSHDIKAAIRFLRANADRYGFDPKRVVVAGASAGGHLAALIGLSGRVESLEGEIGDNLSTSSDVQAVVSFYGASNLQTILSQSTPHGLSVRVPALELLLEGQPDQRPELAKLASPVTHVDGNDPPVWLIHGDADPQMPIEQSRELHQRLKDLGVDVELEVLPGAKHGGEVFYEPGRLERLAEELKIALADTQAD